LSLASAHLTIEEPSAANFDDTTMNLHNHRSWASLTLASYLLANAAAVLHGHQHEHSSGSGSVCQHEHAEWHCHHGEREPHNHRPEGDHRPVPAEHDHDDCQICKYLSNKPLSTPTVAMEKLVEQVILFEPLPLAQPTDVFLAGYDCRGPPAIG